MSPADVDVDPAAALGRRLEATPEDTEARLGLVRLLLERGQPELARRTLAEAPAPPEGAVWKALVERLARAPGEEPGVRRAPAPRGCWSGGFWTGALGCAALVVGLLLGGGVLLVPEAVRRAKHAAWIADLEDPDPAVRVRSARLLLDDPPDEPVYPRIAAALDPAEIESPAEARAAVRLLSRLPRGPGVERALAATARSHPQARARRSAAAGLGRPHAHLGRGRTLGATTSAVAWDAARAAYAARPELRADLLHAVAHPPEASGPGRRSEAAEFVLEAWRSGGRELRRAALRHVGCLAAAPAAERRALAADALRIRSGHVAEAALRTLLRDGVDLAGLDPRAAAAAVRVLREELRPSDAARALLALTDHAAGSVRRQAADALGRRFGRRRIGRYGAIREGRGRWSHRPSELEPGDWERVVAVYRARPELRPSLLAVVARPPADGTPLTARLLLEAREAGSPALAAAALRHLDLVVAAGGGLDPARVEAFVAAGLGHPDEDVAEAALEAGLDLGLLEAGRRFLRSLDESRRRGRGRRRRRRRSTPTNRWLGEKSARLMGFSREELDRLADDDLGERARLVLGQAYRDRGGIPPWERPPGGPR